MFQITWKEYIVFVTSALAIYYLYIVMKYFRKELISLIGRSDKPEPGEQPTDIDTGARKRIWQYRDEPADDHNPEAVLTGTPDRHFTFPNRMPPDFLPQQPDLPAQKDDQSEDGSEALSVMHELQNAVITIRSLFSNSEKPPVIEELLRDIQVILQNNPRLSAQPYRLALNSLITAEAKGHFNVTLSELELNTIWIAGTG